MITETMMLDQPEIPEDLVVGQQTLEDMQEEMELLGISYYLNFHSAKRHFSRTWQSKK